MSENFQPFTPSISIEQMLGRVEGTLYSMQASINALAHEVKEEREHSGAQRQSLADSLATLHADVATLREDMDAVKPFTEKWQRWQYVGFGAILTVGAIGSAIGLAAAHFKALLLQAFSGM